jgi:hypothetical protein
MEHPAFHFRQAAQPQTELGAGARQLNEFLAGMPLPPSDEIGGPGVKLHHHFVIFVTLEDRETAAKYSSGLNPAWRWNFSHVISGRAIRAKAKVHTA